MVSLVHWLVPDKVSVAKYKLKIQSFQYKNQSCTGEQVRL